MPDTIYAVCVKCAHIEPRPEHAAEDWFACENCGERSPLLYADIDAAEDAIAGVLEDAT